MPATVSELYHSPEVSLGNQSSVRAGYVVFDADDEDECEAALNADTPSTSMGLPRSNISFERIRDDVWKAEVTYSSDSYQPDDPPEISFDTSGGTAKITQSKETIQSRASWTNDPPPNHKGAIGVSEGGVEGCDIIVPQFKLTLTKQWPASFEVSGSYIATLMKLTGKTNDAPFFGMARGEALFAGAKGQRKGSTPWKLTYEFMGSENKTGIMVGDMSMNKKGHQYLWIQYEETKDDNAHRFVREPVAAYVERVYDEGNFANLGIGVS